MSERNLEDILCDCIDTAMPDTETSFPCAMNCGNSVGYRDELHGAFFVNKKHWHYECYFDFLFNSHEPLREVLENLINEVNKERMTGGATVPELLESIKKACQVLEETK